jgi:hypothetical protein
MLVLFSALLVHYNFDASGIISRDGVEKTDTFYLSGTFINSPRSTDNISGHNATTDSSNSIGNWTLAVKDGTVKDFNATLKEATKNFNASEFRINGFTSTSDKHIQLGSGGSHMISGTVNVSKNGRLIENNVGITLMMSKLNEVDLILNRGNGNELRTPLHGLIRSTSDGLGNKMESNSTNNYSVDNPTQGNNSSRSVQLKDQQSDQRTASGAENIPSNSPTNPLTSGSESASGGPDTGHPGDTGDSGSDTGDAGDSGDSGSDTGDEG